jgi:hypothetical protein
MILGITLQVYYMAADTFHKITQAVRRPVVNVDNKTQELHLHTGGMPGTPTVEDWAGIITAEKGRKQQ